MLCRTVLAVSAMLLLAAPALAKDCPVQDFSSEAIEEAIRKAPTCRQSMEIMEACAFGATGDTGLSSAVRERCEPEFMSKLSQAQKRAYAQEQKRCDQKYARQSGTMYRSFTAFCQAKSTVAHAAKFGATANAKAKR
jgi:hypothetical protein